jgi:hypothetical protein
MSAQMQIDSQLTQIDSKLTPKKKETQKRNAASDPMDNVIYASGASRSPLRYGCLDFLLIPFLTYIFHFAITMSPYL